MRFVKHAIKRSLERAGYFVSSRQVLPYGIDYMFDIDRLCRAWGLSIRCFFDVGANIGQTSRAALSAFEAATIYAFEPHPETFRTLRSLITDPRFVPCNTAVGDTSEAVMLFDYGPGSVMNSLAKNAQFATRFDTKAGKEISVPCTTIDNFCEQHHIESIDILKIDTEGLELVVLRGAKNVLSTGRVRFVYVEFNDMLPRPGATGGALIPLTEFLSPFGFRLVSTYTDHVLTSGEMFVVANALFVRQP